MLSYDEYEKKCEEIKKTNEEYLEIFEKDMQGLKQSTIDKHIFNVDFYINDYLLYDDAHSMEDGTYLIENYLGYYFIRKCMWSTPATIRSTATSIKKFYKCMLDHGKIEKEAYKELCTDIKYRMEDWQADCAQWNDPDADNPFAFF